MATITPEQRNEVLKVVVGLFNAAPGGAYLNDLAAAVEGGMSTRQVADFLAAHPIFVDTVLAGKVTVGDKVDLLMKNFGLTADSDPASAGFLAADFFKSSLEAGKGFGEIVTEAVNYLSAATVPAEFQATADLLNNKALVAAQYSLDHSSTDLSDLQTVLSGVTATGPKTTAEAITYLDALGLGPNPGNTLALTFGADSLNGGAGNDIFNAGVVNDGAGTLVNSLEDADILNGLAGTDTLNAVLDGGTAAPALSNLEVVNVRALANSTVDFGNAAGVQEIWNNASSVGTTLTLDNAPIAATFGVKNTKSATTITAFDDVSGTADNLALAAVAAGVDGTDAVVGSGDAAAIESMSIAATGANFVDVSAFTAITKLTVTGTGTLSAVVDTTALEEVDASDNSGGVTLDLSAAAGDLTVTGSSGADDITAGTGDDTIDVGAGDDTVTFASATVDDLDTVTGGDGTDTLALDSGDDAAVLDATAHTGFEVLELGAATGAVTFDNTDFDFTKVVLGADITQAVTVSNLATGSLVVQASQAGTIAVGSVGATDAIDMVIDAGAAVTLTAVDVTDVETVKVTTNDATDDTTLTAIETDGVTALSFSGAGDVVITDITDADSANDATTKIATIDLSAQTGDFELATNSLGYGTTFKLGSMGDATDLEVTAGFRDTLQFTTAFAGDVTITGGEFGGDVTDDRIDLSAITGIDSIDDLTFTDTGADVEITSDAFDGTIILAGVASTGDVNVNDFVF